MFTLFTLHDFLLAVLIGVGATAVMDAWLWVWTRLGVRMADFRLIGRWVGHLAEGRLVHDAISRARPVRHELAIGWLTHYAVGIAYAFLLIAAQGMQWARTPTLLPALAIGVATVVVPLFLMQPAMGNGFAAARTPAPLMNCVRSVANHSAFGLGLFITAMALTRLPW